MRQINKFIAFFIVFIILSACTTQKSREDLSFLGKAYHNTTAHYNGYFNANELMMLSEEMLKEQHVDNYNKTLDIFEYINVDNPQAVAGNLDEAIKKVSLVVNLHRQSDWTDDCYLLVGQAQYFKQDYEAAEETFRFFVNEFDPANSSKSKKSVKKGSKSSKKKKSSSSKSKSSKKKKSSSGSKSKKQKEKSAEQKRKEYNRQVKKNKKQRAKSSGKKKTTPKPDTPAPAVAKKDDPLNPTIKKEEKEKEAKSKDEPNNYFMKHRPAFQEGVLWLAKTLIERDNYDGAMRYMSNLENMPNLFQDVEKDLAAVKAYYYYKRQDYNQTIAYLEKALELSNRQDPKARYAFIIAQLHQKAGRGDKAYAAFEQVLKNNPDFEMAFSSKVNMAQNAYLSGKGSSEDAKRNLERMLKDAKNDPYKDQIYYALGQIALAEGNKDEAIKNLELSLKSSRQNRSQKAESYLTLAQLYFEAESFVSAKNYFDSTLQVLPQTDERYAEVQGYSTNLTEIAKNLETIELQDSLLQIAELSDEEKLKLATEIKRKKDEERRKQLEAKNAAQNARSASAKSLPGGGAGALKSNSSFFAYDDRKVKRGKKDFIREWPGRILEDDWRRSNRRSSNEIEEEEVVSIDDSPLTQEEVDKMLGEVPKNDDDVTKSNLMIREAMFDLGSLYRERLDNNDKAIEILEELNRRYPASNYELDSWYYLYLAHSAENNSAKAKEYYNKIIDKYPSSTYAMVLKDPDYASKILDEERKLNNYYDDAYSDFTSGRYQQAFEKSNAAKEKFGAANALQPRFALLSAMSAGNLQGQEAYVTALKEVVAKYPNTDENRRAKEILRLLGVSGAQLPGQQVEDETEFTMEDDKLHYVLVIFNDSSASLTESKAKVSDYNRKFHRLDKLRISNIYLGTDVRTPIIVIRRFKNKAEAMRYYQGIEKNRSDFIDRSVPHEIFAVTQNNYRQILRTKSVNGYRAFFEANYLD